MREDPRPLVLSPVLTAAGARSSACEARGVGARQLVDRADVSRDDEPGVELAVIGSPEGVAELAHRAATDRTWADRVRAAGRARTFAEHTFVHRARDLEALWTA